MGKRKKSVPKKLNMKKVLRYWQVYLFLLLPITYLIIFRYWPMLGVQIAFRKFSLKEGIWGSEFVGLYQFRKFMASYEFKRVLKNTLVVSAYSILAGFPVPILFAVLLNSLRQGKFTKITQTITYMPHFISTVVMVGIILQIFNSRTGLYGTIYSAMTGTYPPDILGKASVFPHLYVLSGVWQSFGWDSIIYLAALTGVSQELHEAAEIDGASRFQRLLHIDFPGILPTITIMLILRAGSVMSVGFEKVYLLQNNLNISASEIISTYVYKIGMGIGSTPNYSYSTAINLFNSVINLIIISTVNAVSRRVSETSLW